MEEKWTQLVRMAQKGSNRLHCPNQGAREKRAGHMFDARSSELLRALRHKLRRPRSLCRRIQRCDVLEELRYSMVLGDAVQSVQEVAEKTSVHHPVRFWSRRQPIGSTGA